MNFPLTAVKTYYDEMRLGYLLSHLVMHAHIHTVQQDYSLCFPEGKKKHYIQCTLPVISRSGMSQMTTQPEKLQEVHQGPLLHVYPCFSSTEIQRRRKA